MVFRAARHAHTHAHRKLYHHTHILVYGPFLVDAIAPKGMKISKMSWTSTEMWGQILSLQFSSVFLSWVSNWASEIGEMATSWNQATNQLYFLLGLNRGTANWGQMRALWGAEGCFISVRVCKKQVFVCVCVLSARNFLLSHIRCSCFVPELVYKCGAKNLLTHHCILVAKCDCVLSSRTRWPLRIDTKTGGNIESILSSGDIKADKFEMLS